MPAMRSRGHAFTAPERHAESPITPGKGVTRDTAAAQHLQSRTHPDCPIRGSSTEGLRRPNSGSGWVQREAPATKVATMYVA